MARTKPTEPQTSLTIKIPTKLREAFMSKCHQQDLSASQVLRSFMKRFTASEPAGTHDRT